MTQQVTPPEGGRYRAMGGYEPLTLGRRFGVFIVDMLVCVILFAIVWAIVTSAGHQSGNRALIISGIIVAVLEVVCWITTSARLGGLLFGVRYVAIETGGPARFRLVGKMLLELVLSVITVFVVPIIVVLTTLRGPFYRNWFDRVCGVVAVDTSKGRRLSDSPAFYDPLEYAFGEKADGGRPEGPTRGEKRAAKKAAKAQAKREAQAAEAQAAAEAAAAASITGLRAIVDDGRVLPLVETTHVIGRAPHAPAWRPDAVPFVMDDTAASKSHLLIGSDFAGPWVFDLNSSNGVYVSAPGGRPVRIPAGEQTPVRPGSTITFGRHTLTIAE